LFEYPIIDFIIKVSAKKRERLLTEKLDVKWLPVSALVKIQKKAVGMVSGPKGRSWEK
jgi:hypothetical protein